MFSVWDLWHAARVWSHMYDTNTYTPTCVYIYILCTCAHNQDMCHYVYVCIRIVCWHMYRYVLTRLGLGVRLKPKDMHTENRPKSPQAKSVKHITAALDSSCQKNRFSWEQLTIWCNLSIFPDSAGNFSKTQWANDSAGLVWDGEGWPELGCSNAMQVCLKFLKVCLITSNIFEQKPRFCEICLLQAVLLDDPSGQFGKGPLGSDISSFSLSWILGLSWHIGIYWIILVSLVWGSNALSNGCLHPAPLKQVISSTFATRSIWPRHPIS